MVGCTTPTESPNYIGVLPSYASNKPHPVNCGCCSNITMLRVVNGQIKEDWAISESDFKMLMKEDSTKIFFK